MQVEFTHRVLDCGVELGVASMPNRRAVAAEMRMIGGCASDPADKLGLAHLVEETLDKGTETYDGRQLQDEFDRIGCSHSSWCGREAMGFTALSLPEHFERSVELHAEMLRRPTFPEDACQIAIELARQDLLTLEDEPQSLVDKLIARQAYGPILGRHVSGEKETLATITRSDFHDYWQRQYCAGRLLVSIAGPIDAQKAADTIERYCAGFGDSEVMDRTGGRVEFSAVQTHHHRDTEQEQIAVAIPGVAITENDCPTQRILIGVLSGGMSSRLFTEVREKQGLVYWVGAWPEYPRNAGMMFVGASTTPQRCAQTYETVMRELKRVGTDVTDEEIERALTGITVRSEIRNDMTRSVCSQLGDDLFHFRRPVPWEEKLAKLSAVTVDDVKRFCATYLRDNQLSVVTLGPAELGACTANA